ncbi:MAG: hypothetical protein AAF570_07325, partial [Bacteroidota bacterium]
QNIRFLKDIGRLDMHVNWTLLIGFPGETEAPYLHYRDRLKWLTHLYPPDAVGGLTFCRYSPYHMEPEAFGLTLEPKSSYRYIYPPIPASSLAKMAYFFQDINVEPEYRTHAEKWQPMLNELVQHWRKRWHGEDGLLLPELYFMDAHTVFDSRNGSESTLPLNSVEATLLQHLEHPISIGKLWSAVGSKAKAESEQALQSLIEKGLVFHDRMKTMISLVLEEPFARNPDAGAFSFY